MWRLSIITKERKDDMSKSETLRATVHPGEVLREDFMKPLSLTVNKLALACTCPPPASVKLCTSAGGSQRRRPSVWHGTCARMALNDVLVGFVEYREATCQGTNYADTSHVGTPRASEKPDGTCSHGHKKNSVHF